MVPVAPDVPPVTTCPTVKLPVWPSKASALVPMVACRTLPRRTDKAEEAPEARRFPEEPQENLLYFIEKNAPLLEPWQREVVRIVRKVAQYFYPQRQSQVMNEGWATFWHHKLLNTMYDDGFLSDGVMIEWLKIGRASCRERVSSPV